MMRHSTPRLAPLQLLQLFLVSPSASFLLLRPDAIFAPPNPTDAANIRQVHPLEALPTPPPFYRRADDSSDDTTLVVDPQTCGFQDGLVDNAFQCVAETRSCTNDGEWIGCCDVGSTCTSTFPTTCIDYDGYESGLCDNKGSRTMCCTDSVVGKCKTLTMLESLSGIACGSEAGSGTILLSPTDYDGPITTVTAATKTTSIQSGGVLGSGQTQSSSDSTQTSIDVDLTDDGEEPRPSTGAIVGGVVGAVVVFALVICGAVWFVKRRKGQEEDDKDLSPHAMPPLPYCIPEMAQTPPGSGSDLGYPSHRVHQSRYSVPSSGPSAASTIEDYHNPTVSGAMPPLSPTRP
ncbi:hypothetical protein MKZ38_001304 [Zalerion maritima]|uniref:Mid2 domain-containing protein n=1 Tax=Zalerion maritima TaxID=339359 RepID=A0AAD5WT74_9PEZI|nr:hypothetical protein MKZ38_001304 [Zalerion maritima]